jgi:Zn-dependent protease with chaperone function
MILTPMEAFIGIAMNVVSRRFEWEADRFACELPDRLKEPEMEDMGDRLGRALITLHVKNLSTVWVDWMCVVFSFLLLCRGLTVFSKVFGVPPFASDTHGATQGAGGVQGGAHC